MVVLPRRLVAAQQLIRKRTPPALPLLCGALLVVPASGWAAASARRAQVRGYVQLCGGPAPGPCRISTAAFCQAPHGCVTTHRVWALDARGRRVASAFLRHARFRMSVPAGTYTFELIGDGRRVRGRVLARRAATVGADHVNRVVFTLAVP